MATDRHVLRESALSCVPFAELIEASTAAPPATMPTTTARLASAASAAGTTATGTAATGGANAEGGGAGSDRVWVLAVGVGLAAGAAVLGWSRMRARRSVRPER